MPTAPDRARLVRRRDCRVETSEKLLAIDLFNVDALPDVADFLGGSFCETDSVTHVVHDDVHLFDTSTTTKATSTTTTTPDNNLDDGSQSLQSQSRQHAADLPLFVLALSGGMCASYAQRACHAIIGPVLAAQLGWTPTQLGLTFTAFLLGYFISQVPGGALADRAVDGGASVLITGLSASAIATALTPLAFSHLSFHAVLACRFACGAAQGLILPSAVALLSSLHVGQRLAVTGLVYSGMYGGNAMGVLAAYPAAISNNPASAYVIHGLVLCLWLPLAKSVLMDFVVERGGSSGGGGGELGRGSSDEGVGTGTISEGGAFCGDFSGGVVSVWATVVTAAREAASVASSSEARKLTAAWCMQNSGLWVAICFVPQLISWKLGCTAGQTALLSALPYGAVGVGAALSGLCAQALISGGGDDDGDEGWRRLADRALGVPRELTAAAAAVATVTVTTTRYYGNKKKKEKEKRKRNTRKSPYSSASSVYNTRSREREIIDIRATLARERTWRTRRLLWGVSSLGPTTALLAFVFYSPNPVAAMTSLTACQLTYGFTTGSFLSYVTDVGGERSGALLGFANSAATVCGAVSCWLAGAVRDATGGFEAVAMGVCTAWIAGLIAWCAMGLRGEPVVVVYNVEDDEKKTEAKAKAKAEMA